MKCANLVPMFAIREAGARDTNTAAKSEPRDHTNSAANPATIERKRTKNEKQRTIEVFECAQRVNALDGGNAVAAQL